MHNYLRAAGFSTFESERTVRDFLKNIVMTPENVSAEIVLEKGVLEREYKYPVNAYIGIAAVELCIDNDPGIMTYYYPYFNSFEITSYDNCYLERHSDKDTYEGIMEENENGLSLIFFVNNPFSYRQRPDISEHTAFNGTALTAFANEGKVLFPVANKEELKDCDTSLEHTTLVEAAMNGDEDAIETLTESDITFINQINDRLETEDIYSLVEQSFMPVGIECDQYTAIGEISDIEESINDYTGEKLYLLKLSCNSVVFDLCIRQDDLLGIPEIGRRIKCRLWLQGKVNMDF